MKQHWLCAIDVIGQRKRTGLLSSSPSSMTWGTRTRRAHWPVESIGFSSIHGVLSWSSWFIRQLDAYYPSRVEETEKNSDAVCVLRSVTGVPDRLLRHTYDLCTTTVRWRESLSFK